MSQTRRAILLAAVLHALALSIPAIKSGNLSGGIRFGCLTGGPCYAEANRSILPEHAPVYRSGGYDGQFYYYIANRIFLGTEISLDSEVFRWARIAYPVLCGAAVLYSPNALVWSLAIIPLFAHLCAIWSLRSYPRAGWVFALNPFSILSASLFLADGLALSLVVMGLVRILDSQSDKRRVAIGWVLVAIACLTKETMLAFSIAYILVNLRNVRSFFAIASMLPLFLWWWYIGFSPLAAAERGIASGFLSYIAQPDTMLSGRSLLFPYILLIAILAWVSGPGPDRKTGILLLLAGTVPPLLASTEYWDNFANIARLFIPVTVGAIICSFWSNRWSWILSAYSLVFCFLILVREWRAIPDVIIY
ncbi:MAG: hypothetical protein K8S54_06545 [Spirochaetia bacterium]|nr:hypothetical protein [Spirochaetia bacterium]